MKAKILIIDDDFIVLSSFQKLLQSQDYEVKTALSGEEGVRLFCLEDFDLVITDIKMPKQNGLETIQKIKDIAQRLGKSAAYIFVTGYAEDSAAQKAAAFGVGEIILKPVDAKDLLESVEREIQLVRRETEQMDSNAEIIRPNSSIGRWQYPDNKICLDRYLLLKETNLLGSGDYDYYHAWQGETKDLLLLQHPDARVWLADNPHIQLVVHSSHQRFFRQIKYGDPVRIEAKTREIRYCSFIMIFRYYDMMRTTMTGMGWQRICSINAKNEKLCRLPRLVLDLIEPLQEENSPSLSHI
ncbi:MAG: response regulator [Candidatus Omnitrophica bacterium]|nr:response regulator [Candidatus Omnitrophota bacterium]